MSRAHLVDPSSSAYPTTERLEAGTRQERRIDLVEVNAAMHRLIEDPDPAVVFGHLAPLCVPAVCDAVTVEFVGVTDAGADGGPKVGRSIRLPVDAGCPGTATVHVGADAGRTGATDPVDYVVKLTCTWRDHSPSPADVALIELLGRCAAGNVRQARSRQAGQSR